MSKLSGYGCMHLDALIDEARSRVVVAGSDARQAAQPIGNLQLLRQVTPGALEACLYEPVLCLILQGSKQVSIGDRTLSFGPGECLLVSHDLPVCSRITKGPYLALVLQLDIATFRKLHEEDAVLLPNGERAQAAQTQRADPGLLDVLRRYLALADSPVHARVLGPLILKEIHYRLLVAPFGAMLRHLVQSDSPSSSVSRAIGHIRDNMRSPMAIPDVARRVGMSASSFHKHFKAVTAATPLQYLKDLRLLEARRLLKARGTTVTSVAFEVGYESSSQFSREYTRKFGVPPSQDLGKC